MYLLLKLVFITHWPPTVGKLSPLNKNLWAIIVMVVNFVVEGVVQWLMVVVFLVILVVDYRENIMTTPNKFALCARAPDQFNSFKPYLKTIQILADNF